MSERSTLRPCGLTDATRKGGSDGASRSRLSDYPRGVGAVAVLLKLFDAGHDRAVFGRVEVLDAAVGPRGARVLGQERVEAAVRIRHAFGRDVAPADRLHQRVHRAVL